MGSPKPDDNAQGSLGQALNMDMLQGLSIGPEWSDPSFKQKAPKIPEERPERGHRGDNKGERRSRRKFDKSAAPRDGGDDEGRKPFRENRGSKQDGGERRQGRGGSRQFEDRKPYRPVVDVALYPEDAPFNALTKAMKQSHRTFELFELAHLILQKNERFVVVLKPLEQNAPEGAPRQFFISVKDGVPFENEDEALNHGFKASVDDFFETEEIEVEPPKGAFNMINKCGVTGELLGPPNYHRYQDLLREHHAQKLQRMSYDAFLRKIESVREEETVQAWIEKMTKQTRYKWKGEFEGTKQPVFESSESARHYAMLYHKDKMVKAANQARFNGGLLAAMPAGGRLRLSVESVVEHQKRFPLDTANHLRGRLRRMNFAVYKKGSKGVSYTCAVKRKFRKQDEVFAAGLQEIIEYIERNPEITGLELLKKCYNIELPAESTSEEDRKAFDEALSKEDREVIAGFMRNKQWLVGEGYVIEMADGRMIAVPAMDGQTGEHGAKSDGESAKSKAKKVKESVTSGEPDESATADAEPEVAEAQADAEELTLALTEEPVAVDEIAESEADAIVDAEPEVVPAEQNEPVVSEAVEAEATSEPVESVEKTD